MRDMEESPRMIMKAPDVETAFRALEAAAEMVAMASEKLEKKDYPGAFDQSRDAVRVAASALLFKDGRIAQTLEATSGYIDRRYPERFRLKDWHWMEKTVSGDGPGLLNMLIRAMGKGAGEREARRAVDIATEFLANIRELVYL